MAFAGSLALSAFATGSLGINQPQSGSSSFTASTGLSVTNTFTQAFASQPAVVIFPQATNNNPFTVSSVTLSNFVLTVTTGASTNVTVNWTAFAGFPRVQVGTNIFAGAGTVTNTFPVPYVLPPIINVEGSTTNTVAATSVTTTNVIFQTLAAQTIYWGALGIAYAPGLNTVTY